MALGRKWLLLHTLFGIQAFESETQGTGPSSESIDTASRIVDTVDEMAWAGGLQVWHDIASINISTLCLYLWKVRPLTGMSSSQIELSSFRSQLPGARKNHDSATPYLYVELVPA